jgi:hypothetical protein
METIKSEDEILCILKLARTYWDQNLSYEHRRYAVNGFHTAIDMVLAKKPEGISLTEDDFCDMMMLELANTYWVKNHSFRVFGAKKRILKYLNRDIDEVLESGNTVNASVQKKPICRKSPVSVSTPTTPISVSQVPVTPVKSTPTLVSRALPSTEKATCVLAPYSPEVDPMVECAYEVCLVDIFFLPYSCPPLKKTSTKVSAFPLSHAAADLELAEHQDDDSENDETFFSRIAKELSSHDDVLSEEEGQVQDLNFIVEGCTFRGDIEIPTPPPADSEQDDSRAPWEREELPDLDYDHYRAMWEYEEDNKRKAEEESCYREPSPPTERYIPSAAFTRSAVEERSNTPPDDFDRYLAETFRPVTVPLLPATPKTPTPQTTSPRAATNGVARAARVVPSSDMVARRLSYSDVSAIRHSHGERDPNLGAVSDEDSRCDDDYGVDPDEWQDQSLYDAELFQHIEASYSTCPSPDGLDSDASSSCGPQSNRDDYSDSSSVQSDRPDSDCRSEVSADGYDEYGDY